MAYLEITDGPRKGMQATVSDGMILGRNPNSTLCIVDAGISRQHAEIRLRDGYFSLLDLGSANGTMVNGTKLHQLVPRPLYEGDEITAGASRMIFRAQGIEPPGTHRKMPAAAHSNASPGNRSTSLSVIMTPGDRHRTSVSATLDASRVMLDLPRTGQSVSPQFLLSTVNRLHAMIKVSNELGAVSKPELLLERIMAGIFDIFPSAERAFVLTRNANGDFTPVAARNRSEDPNGERDFPISQTVIGTVAREKQSILLSDALSDSRFAEQKSIVNFSIRSLMCAPFLYKDEVLGIIGVDTASGAHAFDENDLGVLTGIAAQAAIAIKNADLYVAIEKETHTRTQLSRYLSPDIVEGILDGKIPLHLGGEKKRGTILFCDIVGFTSIAENLSATDVIDRLNQYFSVVTEIITQNRGTLHKFGGDMVMAFWNVMFDDDLAELHSIRSGLEMQNAVWLFDLDLEAEGQRPIHLGVGCNTGEFAGGNIGGSDRMEYTVIGDNVNLAQRIESLASRWQVLVASETFDSIKENCIAVGLPPLIVKGKTRPIKIYSIRGLRLDASTILLTIPVSILAPDNSMIGWGMLSKYQFVNDNFELHLSTAAVIPSWARITVQFDLPEVSALRITGALKTASQIRNGHRAVYSSLILTELQGDDIALSLLKEGTVIESRKSWPEMKRH